jgi:hypothetical protein
MREVSSKGGLAGDFPDASGKISIALADAACVESCTPSSRANSSHTPHTEYSNPSKRDSSKTLRARSFHHGAQRLRLKLK